MPPTNTPARNPSSPESPSQQRPLTPLSFLSSPVPDLAATLHDHTEDGADDANVSFLRSSLGWLAFAEQAGEDLRSQTRVDARRDPRRSAAQESAGGNRGGGGDNSYNNETAIPVPRHETSEDFSRRERLQRVLARLNRLHEPTALTTWPSGSRTPSPLPQRLYDWNMESEDDRRIETEFDAMLAELRRQRPESGSDTQDTAGRRRTHEQQRLQRIRESDDPGLAEIVEWRQRMRERELRRRDNETTSLRSRAVLARASQEALSSPLDRAIQHVAERQRSGLSEQEDRASRGGWYRPTTSGNTGAEADPPPVSSDHWLLPVPSSERAQRRQERIEAYRRAHLPVPTPRVTRTSTPPAPAPVTRSMQSPATANASSTLVESVLKYLSELRTSLLYSSILNTESTGMKLAMTEISGTQTDDWITDIDQIEPLGQSSWLQPGSLFEGDQHAASFVGTVTHQRSNSNPHVVEQINPNFRSSQASTISIPADGRSGTTETPRPSGLPTQTTAPQQSTQTVLKQNDPVVDHWPVRVVIHSVDMHTMTLQGTMEAYDVPQHSNSLSMLGASSPSADLPKAGKKSAPITTYFEGHIIDMRTHSFLTPETTSTAAKVGLDAGITFPASSARTDAANWRKISPFIAVSSDTHLARMLLSRSAMAAMFEEYIFMRWKERCFVHARGDHCEGRADGDHDRGHGLTISGFYYVSLRRSDGVVQGLYFDPESTPYQHLGLKGKSSGWPALEMR